MGRWPGAMPAKGAMPVRSTEVPKETIYRESTYVAAPASEAATLPGQQRVTTMVVGWDEARGVEIVMVYEIREAERTDDGEVTTPHADPDSDFWMYAHLSRSQINRLIRVLRQARDKVFGRDE